jgi:hypothetical protein
MRTRQILQYWMERYGPLSLASQERFLRRQETERLTRYPDEIVRKAIGWSNLLNDALSFAHSAYEGEAQSLPPEPQTPSRPSHTRKVAEAPQRPDPELQRRMASAIGPVQNYEDSF